MKKVICGLIFIVALSFCCVSAFAVTSISLDSAKINDGMVTVNGRITEPSNYQRYTAVVLKYKESGEYTLSDAVYIGQKEKEEVSLNNGVFSFKFKGNFGNGEKYVVRIGGSNVPEPSKTDLKEGTGEENPTPGAFVLGDVNGDGVVLVDDASILLQFVLDEEKVSPEIKNSENFFERSNVTGGEELTAETVSNILQKALKPDFEFK